MKKLFFFRSYGSPNAVSPPSTDKEVFWEKASESGQGTDNIFKSPKSSSSRTNKQVAGNKGPHLRRSRSYSSEAFLVDGMGEKQFSPSTNQSRSPRHSVGSGHQQQYNHSSQLYRVKPFETEDANVFKTHHYSSGNSSSCSSNVSSKVLDRYIEGEERLERRTQKKSSSHRHASEMGNGKGKLPPRVHYTDPTSPLDIKNRPKSQSFREAKVSSSRLGNESPQRYARMVLERLSQTHGSPKLGSNNASEHDLPITVENIYGGSLDWFSDSNSNLAAPKGYSLAENLDTLSQHSEAHNLRISQNILPGGTYEGSDYVDTDEELRRKSKEAEERAMQLSEELEQESFLSGCGFDIPSLVQAVRKLVEERIELSFEISSLLQSRISERVSAKEEIRLTKAELELQARRLEKEKAELQAGLEKELDRRSSDWSFKLGKYHSEELRLRERVRELAEENVSLQREVSTFHEKETESRNAITVSERKLIELTGTVEEITEENRTLRESISELQEKHQDSLADLDCIRTNFGEKDKECRELQKSLTRLFRACNDQENTIKGLRDGLGMEIEKKQPVEESDKLVQKLQTEQMRLTGLELTLRKEIESSKVEVDSLRQENIHLLNRLKGVNKVDVLTFKLDTEMRTRISCLQDQGLSMLKESIQLSSKLLEFVKWKAGKFSQAQDVESNKNGLDRQFIVESDMRIQGITRGAENLTRSLQTVSTLLHEKYSPVTAESESRSIDHQGSEKLNDQLTKEEAIRTELKAETLLTTLLREKIYSKELQVEQLEAELATAVRGNEILRFEVQNALDNLSCATHRSKEIELQMLKKDERVDRLQSDLHETTKELTILKEILPKVTKERDMMWEKLKEYSEKTMILNSENGELKKKIESLDEDLLLKDGQISILKDNIGNRRHFDLLASPESMRDFFKE